MKKLWAISTLVVLLQPACVKEEKGAEVGFQLRTINRYATVNAARGPIGSGSGTQRFMQGSLTWQSGFARVSHIAFEGTGYNGLTEFRTSADQNVNLFVPVADLNTLTVKPGNYENVTFELSLYGKQGNPALDLLGTYNGATIIFRIEEAFKIEGEQNEVHLDAAEDYTSLISLELSRLTDGIYAHVLDAADRDNTGAIIITSQINSDLYYLMLDNFKNLEDVYFD